MSKNNDIVDNIKMIWAKNLLVHSLVNIKEERKQEILQVGELQEEAKLLKQEKEMMFDLGENALSCRFPRIFLPISINNN